MLSGVSVELKTCNAALLEATGKSWEEVRHLTKKIMISSRCYFHGDPFPLMEIKDVQSLSPKPFFFYFLFVKHTNRTVVVFSSYLDN